MNFSFKLLSLVSFSGIVGCTLASPTLLAQDAVEQGSTSGQEETHRGVEYYAPRKMEMQFGMRFHSNDNYCTKLHATIPFPLNWPEQTVTVLSQQVPPNMIWMFRDLPTGVKQSALARQLVMDVPSLSPNNEMDMIFRVEIEKSFIKAPADTSVFVIPKKLPNEMNWFMKKSPYIDIEHSEIRRVAKQIAAENSDNAWQQVEKLYDWVRSNIEYRDGKKIREIKDALKDRKGDCEEMTGIFVALCRASKIPARCVWVPEHCYPEFYLEDDKGEGHWFPCQAAGERQFGEISEYRPILQKGDRFVVPEERAPVRYIAQFFSCSQRPARPGLDPAVEEIRDLGPLEEEMEQLRAEAANMQKAAEKSNESPNEENGKNP
jgi:hypothetical protein